jgi:hypothetical protein
MPSVLALGLDPTFVNPQAISGINPEVVRSFIESHLDRIRGLGYEVDSCLVDLGDTAEIVLKDHLRKGTFDCVLIGAGLRAPEQSILFEKLLNVVHSQAPRAKICFNATPSDSAEAVQRWI